MTLHENWSSSPNPKPWSGRLPCFWRRGDPHNYDAISQQLLELRRSLKSKLLGSWPKRLRQWCLAVNYFLPQLLLFQSRGHRKQRHRQGKQRSWIACPWWWPRWWEPWRSCWHHWFSCTRSLAFPALTQSFMVFSSLTECTVNCDTYTTFRSRIHTCMYSQKKQYWNVIYCNVWVHLHRAAQDIPYDDLHVCNRCSSFPGCSASIPSTLP